MTLEVCSLPDLCAFFVGRSFVGFALRQAATNTLDHTYTSGQGAAQCQGDWHSPGYVPCTITYNLNALPTGSYTFDLIDTAEGYSISIHSVIGSNCHP